MMTPDSHAELSIDELESCGDLVPLARLLQEGDPEARRHAARALGGIEDGKVVEALVSALKDPDCTVRQNAAWGLDRQGWKPTASEASIYYWATKGAWAQCVKAGRVAVKPLSSILQGCDEASRSQAALALGKIGEPAAAASLITALEDPAAPVRAAAAKAIGMMGDPQGTRALIRALEDPVGSVRKVAVCALSKLGGGYPLEVLEGVLRDPNCTVRAAAAEALGAIGNPQAIPALRGLLCDRDCDVRRKAAAALDSLHWEPDCGESGAYYWAAKGEWTHCLEGNQASLVPILAAIQHCGCTEAEKAVEARAALLAAKPTEALISALGDGDRGVRRLAAELLGEIADPAGVPVLLEALGDESGFVRVSAASALGKIGDLRAIDALVLALHDRWADVRRAAVGALERFAAAGELGEKGRLALKDLKEE